MEKISIRLEDSLIALLQFYQEQFSKNNRSVAIRDILQKYLQGQVNEDYQNLLLLNEINNNLELLVNQSNDINILSNLEDITLLLNIIYITNKYNIHIK